MTAESDLLARIAALEADNAALRHRDQERSEFLRAFFAAVSHDLRAPVRVLDGFCRILHDDYGPRFDDNARRLLTSIGTGSQRLDAMVSGLVRIGRAMNREFTTAIVPMQAVVQDAVKEIHAAQVDRNIDFSLTDLPDCKGNAALIRELLHEILDNAVKFTHPRTSAAIAIAGAVENDRTVRYTIEDNGVGFEPRYAGRLFDVFQRLHAQSEFEGHGIGLALCAQILKRLGGTIAIDGRQDGGATVTFALPR